ncbi:transcriptional regulator [Rhizobium rosettiformans]|uniref:Transcriptional regulator n=1 Tax=Rhizobium rosettiformans TaxID=1368430 RepID=A0ABX7EZ86_9HYPH|nr:ParB N-terminal domain-containing protein [Rhizobium rosettiformans]QRF53548.1 transcriptional regulator [Rhizobium rosettiformans]
MATLKTILISQIHVGERARPVDEDHALAIAGSMVDRGLINPITVRSTPAANGGATPYTLVAGGHRLRAAELNGWDEIDVLVVSTDVAEAQLIEISENLFRNELSALDRGIFVVKFREIFEEKHGKIARGGDRKSKGHGDPLIFAPGKHLSERVQERLGIGPKTYQRATSIGLKLTPALRAAVRGTPAEDDQNLLLKLASLPETEQAGIVGALKVEPDIYKALDILKPEKVKADPQDAIFDKVVKLLQGADDATLQRILDHIGESRDLSFLESAA